MKFGKLSVMGVGLLAVVIAPAAHAASPAAGPAAAPLSVSPCHTSSLGVSVAQEGAATGHVGATVQFTNTTTTVTCTLSGYPTAKYGLVAGGTLWASKTLSGWIGGVMQGTTWPTVTLSPGQSASAIVEWVDMPADGQQCPAVSTDLQITPPGVTGSWTLPGVGSPCQDFQVHPVVPGLSGDF